MAGSHTLEQAVNQLKNHTRKVQRTEKIPILKALGRISADTITAPMDQPPFPRSPLDGYAVRHQDLESAEKDNPAVLQVIGCVYAGDPPQYVAAPGQAVRIMTGAPIPEGADCVVRQEDTAVTGEHTVAVFQSLKEHQNYCFAGEDVAKGQIILKKGEKITAGMIGLLASQGITQVKVLAKIRIAIISTGSELIQPGEELCAGKIYDSNRFLLTAYAEEKGMEVCASESVPDDAEVISRMLEQYSETADLVICTGGVSVGEKDYMEAAGTMAGAQILFHGVKLKPGSPVLAMKRNETLVLCLSGNPYAAFATFVLLVLPVVEEMLETQECLMRRGTGIMNADFLKASPGRRFVRARQNCGQVDFAGDRHASGMISSLAGSNCLIDVPAGSEGLRCGDQVNLIVF